MTCDLYNRVTEQQGYEPHEYEVLAQSKDIDRASVMEIDLQNEYGYKVDRIPYNKLKCNNMKIRINVTEQTTTFPCPVNKLKGQLMDSMGMKWGTEFGDCMITDKSIKWILKNVKESMYNTERCYIYNKAFSRWFDNNNAYSELDLVDQYDGKTLAGALTSPSGTKLSSGVEYDSKYEERMREDKCCDYLGVCECAVFDDIRIWADLRGLYDNGDPKTQALKLVEEVGETCRAILKNDTPEMYDGIGDCVVVLTNLAHLCDTSIEECIEIAYNEIKDRKGKMANGTYDKND